MAVPELLRIGVRCERALADAIDVWASHWNDDPKPFVWHATAKDIIAKVRRARSALDHQTKSATDH